MELRGLGLKGLCRNARAAVQAREESGSTGESRWPPWGWINVILQEPGCQGLLQTAAVQPREGKAVTQSHEQNKSMALGGVWVRTKHAVGCRLRAGATAAGPGG